MRFQYKGFVIDATPDFSLGEYWGHARISKGTLGCETTLPLMEQVDIGHFLGEALAVEHAVDWARQWIDGREQG